MTSEIGLQTAGIAVIANTLVDIDGDGNVVAGKLKKVFDPPPPKIDTAQLPAFYVFTGQTENYDDSEHDSITITRTYRMQVVVIPTGQGNPYTRETLCRPLIDLVTKEFIKYPSIGNVPGVQNASVMKDSGIVVLPEWGFKFIGFEVPLEVVYVIPRTYETGE